MGFWRKEEKKEFIFIYIVKSGAVSLTVIRMGSRGRRMDWLVRIGP